MAPALSGLVMRHNVNISQEANLNPVLRLTLRPFWPDVPEGFYVVSETGSLESGFQRELRGIA
jgi:hypothetical protein